MISEIQAKSILRKNKRVDSWFLSGYGMNIYRGCTHNCAYCDGRAEGYYVNGEFGRDVEVKTNAPEILEGEIKKLLKKEPFQKGFILLGGGVCDGYQPIEEKYELSRKALELLNNYNLPVHLLTKSILVKRDLDLIKKIHAKNKIIVSMSFSSCNDSISKIVEPGVPIPSEKLKLLKQFKSEGISCGMFLMPVIPFITDNNEMLEDSISKAKENGIDFIIFGGMTLKEGKQKEHFYNVLKNIDINLKDRYNKLYTNSKWGNSNTAYYNDLNKRFYFFANKYKMPIRIPLSFFNDIVDESNRVAILLDQMDYFLQLKGENPIFRTASWNISQLKKPLIEYKYNLESIPGITKNIGNTIREILETKNCNLYQQLFTNISE